MKQYTLRNLRRRKSAFTLIEIMVATVIMVVLVGLVIQITSEVLKVWNRSSGKLSANAEARIALELLTQDLETAILQNDGLRWLEAVQEDFDDPLTGSSFVTTNLKLFAPALDRPEGRGDICGIGYLLDYKNPIDGSDRDDRTFVLYRHLIEPELTFDELMGEGQQEEFASNLWDSDSIRDDGRNYLVSNVVDFRIDFFVEDDGDENTPQLVPSPVLFGGSDSTVGPRAVNAAATEFERPLAYADITLRVISDEVLQIVQNDVLGQTGFDSWREYIAANSEVYIRRVNFLTRPL